MIYPDNFEQKTGIDSIRKYITEKCLGPLGEEQVAAMGFSSDYKTISTWLDQTGEFLQILRNKEGFPTEYFLDVREPLQRIEKDVTSWLSECEIADLSNSLHTIVRIVDFLHGSKYPALTSMANKIKAFPALVDRTNAILDKSTVQVKDNASRRLSDIRSNKSEVAKAINRNMQAAMRDAQAAGLISRDTQLSLRDGRMTIPVSAGNKRKIKGTVHEGSGSGKTVYIEPEAVVLARKRFQDLEADEYREVVKILIDFTELIRPHITDLLRSYRFMADIDFIRAKAGFAVRINGIKPVFEDKQQVEWVQAVHPLLNIQLLMERKQAHPLDISLNSGNRLLIVSGANAGGKSLCLKTVALLQYMLQCGLLIPVHESSRTGIFENIFIDIGDGQSMENSLSTYTSHLTSMKFFVANSTGKTLILIDEFGGGTEPQIGGAIAETLLDRFNQKHSFGVITTHFQNLKYFAYKTDGIINGAMLYDAELMQPLYRLSIGNPGSSFAVEVALKIGLPEDIIADASGKIGNEYINMDNFLQSIAKDKIFWEDKRKEAVRFNDKPTEPPVKPARDKAGKPVAKQPLEDAVIEKGDSVTLNGHTTIGVVLEMKGKQAVVAFGSVKSTVGLERLDLVSKAI